MTTSLKNRPKILYAIQGTGNGHVTRAREVLPQLVKFGEVHLALSGDQSEVDLPAPVKYRPNGLTFIYNQGGGISFSKTLWKNNLPGIIREIREFPVEEYDVVINDFECITAWACRLKGKRCFGLSHQASFFSRQVPRPGRRQLLGEAILKHYAPCTDAIGFHYKPFDQFVYPPVIRQEIRRASPANQGHYTVYLPAYGDEQIYRVLSKISNRDWQVFSKMAHEKYERGNVTFYPVSNDDFIESFVNCEGVITSAGFETPSEALYLGKKLFVIPIKNQYEQYCNAEALRQIEVPVAHDLNYRTLQLLQDWVYSEYSQKLDFPDKTGEILQEQIFDRLGQVVYWPAISR